MAKASHKGMGVKTGVEHVGDTPPDATDRDDFADEIHGRNSLQGNDQNRVRNERQAVPDAKRETEGVVESFEKRRAKKRAGH